VVGLRQNRSRPAGLVALRITTTDQHGEPVLDFVRCAMIPLRDPTAVTGHDDELSALPDPASPDEAVRGWNLAAFPAGAPVGPGTLRVDGGDVVSSAPELARLTLNVARVHHDAAHAGGRRLVYGGHTIGIALAQACRALPGLVTVVAWEGCDHTGPVHEGDTLRSTVEVQRVEPLRDGGALASLRSVVTADGDEPRPVLDWRYVAVVA
jgi:acyl dehydratase